MLARLTTLPLFVLLLAITAAAMIVPAAYAYWGEDNLQSGRMFFYGGILAGSLAIMIGLATRDWEPRSVVRSQLVTLASAFLVLPLVMAVPFWQSVPGSGFSAAWFEMVSSLTTTGASLWDNPADLSGAVHLWRSLVGWLGGLLIWVAALAILAPMNLGGFEVRAHGTAGEGLRSGQGSARIDDPSERMVRYAAVLAPFYVGLTVLLWIGLVAAGDTALTGLCHAMAILSTSGISPVGGLTSGAAGLPGEALILGFFLLALSQRTFSGGLLPADPRPLWRDPEVALALVLVALVTSLLFLRHFLAGNGGDPLVAARALWGTLFTVLSFLTTTGFESAGWLAATDWSGLKTPGLILMGLAIIGGGIATTAGGLKLLRVYAILRHSERELGRLVLPSSLGGSGAEARRIRRQGAYIAWIAFVLFLLSLLVVMFLVSLFGTSFETAMILSIAALTTTGPLADVAATQPVLFSDLSAGARAVLAFAMVLGRLETLALIALFNPDFWRR
jgi:trk system potassium uptake protein